MPSSRSGRRFGAILMTEIAFTGIAMLLGESASRAQQPAPAAAAPASQSTESYDALSKEAKAAKAAEAAKTPPTGDPADPSVAPIAATAPADGAAPAAAGDVPPAAPKPILDRKGRPIKVKEKKEKPPKLMPVNIVKGELTVDGLIAKADLNFQVLDLHYLFIWVPGMGTAIISNNPFPGSKLQVDALDGNTLTVKVDGHRLQLTCDRSLLPEKKPKPLSLYVGLDAAYQRDSIYPEFGYGDKNAAPYNWPGTLANADSNSKAPPLPANLKQKTQIVKMCAKNPDGTQGACREVEVPLVLGKKS